MSGSFPSTQGLRGLDFKNNQPNLVSVSVSGRRQAKSQGAQYFSFTVQTPPMTVAEHKKLMGFMASQQGQFEAFQIQLPNLSTPQGSVAGNVLDVAGAHTAGDKTINLDGGLASQTGYLKAGDMIRFIDTTTAANNVKTYMVTADMDTDGSGAGTVSIEPGLIDGVANNSTTETNGVQFTVFMSGPTQEYSSGVADFTQLEFEVREAF
jgi:hypothetical protein